VTWTYSGDPSSSAKDEIRFLVGDTDENIPEVSDEEIAYIVTMHADPGVGYGNYTAAAVLAQAIAAKYAKKADKSVGGLSIQYKQKYDNYVALAETLRGYARTGPTGAIVGAPLLGGGGTTYLGNEFD
jgi:hypothetical protein